MSAFALPSGGSPEPVAGMLAWYDAADTASLTIVSNKVSQWNDLSGNGHNLTQGTAGSRPLYSGTPRTINGITIPEFTGAAGQEFMESTCPRDDRTASAFIAMLIDTHASSNVPLGDTQGGGWELRIANTGAPNHLKSGVATLAAGDFAIAAATVQVFGSQMDATTHYFEYTGRQNTKSDSTTFTAGRTLRVGKDTSGTIRFDGIIAEIILYGSKLTDDEVNQNMTYLASKWY